jgi:hypothetical protein
MIAPLLLENIPASAIDAVGTSVLAGLFDTSGTALNSGTNIATYDTTNNLFYLVYAYDPNDDVIDLSIGIEIINSNPFLPILKCVDDVLYLYHHADYSHIVSYSIEQNYESDLVERWSTTFGPIAIQTISASIYDAKSNGLMIHNDIYPYHHVINHSTTYVYAHVYRINDTDGTQILRSGNNIHRTYTIAPSATDVILELSYPLIYIVYKHPILYASHGDIASDINGSIPGDDKLTIRQLITTNALAPIVIPHPDAVTLLYGFSPNTDNILQFANIFLVLDEDTDEAQGLGLPIFYNINKTNLYSEPEAISQTNLHYSYTVNPSNDNYIYIAYITTTNEIRIVKLFRHELATPTLFEKYKYMILWSTKVGAFQGFTYTDQGLHILVDTSGIIYVFARMAETIYMWKISEFRLHLGHTFDVSITASANIISDFLNSVTTKYTVHMIDPLFSDEPEIKEVIISSVVDDNANKRITLRYLNYDYFISSDTARSELINGFQTAFNNLYLGTEYQPPSNGIVLEGDAEHVILVFTTPDARNNPCILRGTEILVSDGHTNSLVPVETIKNDSYVINHQGKITRVKRHTCESLISRNVTRPYLIPSHFFGHNRPYKTLGISGDHAILYNGKRIYPKDIFGLKRIDDGMYIEYHHIEMEKPAKNFFFANGLEIESLYFGTRFDRISVKPSNSKIKTRTKNK